MPTKRVVFRYDTARVQPITLYAHKARRYSYAISLLEAVKRFGPVFIDESGRVGGPFLEPNPRRPKYNKNGALKTTDAIEGIQQTIDEEPEKMLLRSKGIIIVASEARCANDRDGEGEGQGTVVLDTDQLNGLLDGGHTFAAIYELYLSCFAPNTTGEPEVIDEKRLAHFSKAHLWLLVKTGIDREDVASTGRGLNTALQVDEMSCANQAGKFDDLKVVMGACNMVDMIAWKAGDDAHLITARKVIQLAMTWNTVSFPVVGDLEKDSHPTICYSGADKAQDRFVELTDDEPDRTREWLNCVVPAVLKLRDEIQHKFLTYPKYRLHGKKKDKDGDFTGKTEFSRGKTKFPFLGLPDIDGSVPEGFVIPILSAYRANVMEVRAKFRFRVDMDQLFHETISKLINKVFGQEYKQDGTVSDRIGKKTGLYADCYEIVQNKIEVIEAKQPQQRLPRSTPLRVAA